MSQTPKTNKASVLSPERTFSYEERAIPTLQSERDVIVRVVATGLCGSDVHYWQHGRIGRYEVTSPLILGHESSGIVVSHGSKAHVRTGDRVAIEPGIACNVCPPCRSGRYNLCKEMRFAATPPYDGTLCAYYRVPTECCYRLPSHVSLRDGALVEPLGVAVHGCRLAGDLQGKGVIVFGAGPVGLLCAAVARAFGAGSVVVVDIVQARVDVAGRYGATGTYLMEAGQSAEENAGALAEMHGFEDGADVVLDATGAAPCLNCGIHVLARGGTFVQVGLGRPSVEVPVGQICDKEAVFKGSFRYGPGDFELAVQLLDSRRVCVDGLVTHEFGFEGVEEAFKHVAGRGGIKSVIFGPEVDVQDAKKSH
ncbi:chaperonin 10-like protein [Aspergillus avenaceus]|uniref:D-xylulose reductase n=1 Tax=Aspergillus avenaceus TaxID=36643 RepID=A0A5N6U6A0_ASPAV|nr:chaperonin 10-like protein [Aspergillus avenaceus]